MAEKERTSITTRGVMLFNTKSDLIKSALDIGMYDGYLSLSILPERTNRTDKETRFDRDKSVKTGLSIENVGILVDFIGKKFSDAIEKGEIISKGVFLGNGTTIVEIGTGLNDTICPYIAIYKEINSDRIPEQMMFYEFNSSPCIENYNYKTGDFTPSKSHGELIAFYFMLKGFLTLSGNAAAHSMRVTDNFFRNKYTGYIESIMEKLGIQVEKKTYSNNTNSGKQANPFNSVKNLPGVKDNDDVGKVPGPTEHHSMDSIDQLDSFI